MSQPENSGASRRQLVGGLVGSMAVTAVAGHAQAADAPQGQIGCTF